MDFFALRKTTHSWLLIMAAMLLFPTQASCKNPSSVPVTNKEEPIPPMGTRVPLTVTGYNYTNRYINQFSAGGNSGGNLYISSPGSGGGGSVCCVPYIVGAGAWKIKIRWQVGGCTYNNKMDKDGTHLFRIHHSFKEIEVQIDPNIPKRPNYLEVHFYPDGHVEAAITENDSSPRLALDERREDKSPYPRCENDKRP